jgi:hypothetical protein
VSGKRSLKKQQKREESALADLEEMIRRGAEERFLARAAELFPDPSASPLGARWAEVADRALRQCLARADFNRLESLLRSLRRTGRPRPLAALSEAVLDLAAGRRTAARSKLAALSPAGQPAPELPGDLGGLLGALQALSADELPQESPYLRAAEDLLRACRGLEACGFALSAADRAALARSLHALRGAAPAAEGEPGRLLGGFLESAERCLRLLDGLAALDAALLRREEGAPRASEMALAWLRDPGPARAAALAAAQTGVGMMGTMGPLLAALQHTARCRWRAVLERVTAQEGSAGLAALCAADPKLLLADVDLSGGTHEGLAGLRKRAQADRLAAGRRYGDLAALLRDRSRTASTEGEVAAAWGLELWARGQPALPGGEEDDGDGLFQEPRPYRTLVRLEEMAGEIGTRFSPAHRAEIAGVLRGELFTVCEEIDFCEHTAGAALSLLKHEPGGAGQTGLFIAGVAGAVIGGDHRALRALQDRLSRRGKVPAGEHRDQEIIRRLMAGVADEGPATVARILDVVRPLFDGGGWPEAAALVAEKLGRGLAFLLGEVSPAIFDEGESGRLLGDVRRDLSLLRPSLAETPGFAAMELLLDCWRPDRRAAEKRLATFLAAAPDLIALLTALRVLERVAIPRGPRGIRAAFEGLVRAVIERLDDRWQLWCDDVPLLARAADGESLRRLEQKAVQLLAAKETSREGRAAVESALTVIRQALGPRRKKPRRGRAGSVPKGRS